MASFAQQPFAAADPFGQAPIFSAPSTFTAAPFAAPLAAPLPMPMAAPMGEAVPMAPPVPLDGSPVELILQGERKESEYEWFRYSKCAFPFLLLLLFCAGVLFMLTCWQGNMTVKELRPGLPIEYLKNDESLEGAENRTMRIIGVVLGGLAVALVMLVVYLRPAPSARKGAYFLGALLLLLSAIFLVVGMALDFKDFRSTAFDDEMLIATAVTACVAAVTALVLLGMLVYVAISTGKESDVADFDAAFAAPVKKGVGKGTRNMVVFLLFLFAFCLVALVVLTIWHEEHRPEPMSADSVYGVIEYSNLRPGWPVKNTRLRLAASAALILLIVISLIPFRSRVVAYVLAFLILLTAPLFVMAFSMDVHHIISAKDLDCPVGYDCRHGRFVATAIFDFILALLVMIYVVVEFILRWATQSSGPSRILY